MPKRPKSRVYWRGTSKSDRRRGRHRVPRAYGDFRDYAAVGGGWEPLKAPGAKRATTDSTLAEQLAAQRLAELETRRLRAQGRAIHGLPPEITLAEYARLYLIKRRQAGSVSDGRLEEAELHLTRAIDHFGENTDLNDITPAAVGQWSAALAVAVPGTDDAKGRRALSGGARRGHLNTLSNLFRHAAEDGYVPPHHNPVAVLTDKPQGRALETKWLEVYEAALLLEAARRYRPKRDDIAVPFAYELIATALLTGGRPEEVLGLEVADVSFDRATITFRPNEWRRRARLKTSGSEFRTVPLWPQLREILERYLANRPPSRLLFPSYRTGKEAILKDARKLIDAVAGFPGGWKPRELNMRFFRHTFTAAALQLLDRGAPISPYTVGKWLGHGGDALVRKIYGHLGEVRHRSKHLEFRIAQHRAKLKDRLAGLNPRKGD